MRPAQPFAQAQASSDRQRIYKDKKNENREEH